MSEKIRVKPRQEEPRSTAADSSVASRALKHLRVAGYKNSTQRIAIIEAFFAAKQKVTAEELGARLRAHGVSASDTTVRRALNALLNHGFATVRQVAGGQSRFELAEHEYHGHLVCTRCRTRVEFVDDRIERIEETAARRLGFDVHAHRLEFYGLCDKCRSSERSPDER